MQSIIVILNVKQISILQTHPIRLYRWIDSIVVKWLVMLTLS